MTTMREIQTTPKSICIVNSDESDGERRSKD
jgi:hypothetical protein